MKKVLFASVLAVAAPLVMTSTARALDNSQSEGNYNGSNSQGAAVYYHGGGQQADPGYGGQNNAPAPQHHPDGDQLNHGVDSDED